MSVWSFCAISAAPSQQTSKAAKQAADVCLLVVDTQANGTAIGSSTTINEDTILTHCYIDTPGV